MNVVPRPLAVVTRASTGMGLELVWMVFNALWIWSLHPISRGFCRRSKNHRSKESPPARH
jgi:hypothetical protein